MILKKPYAIFIKYFKILHLFLAGLIAVVLYRSISVYNYFRIYSIDYKSVIGGISDKAFLSPLIFVFIAAVLSLVIILLVVMIYKSKPKRLYIFMTFIYIFAFILLFYSRGVIESSSSNLLDIKVSKAIRDLSLMLVMAEFVSLLFTVVRATGFDIKEFDFVSDLQQLDISAEDSEEIEVALEFDKEEIKRNIRNKVRGAKYAYFEHKFIVDLIVLSVIMIIGIITFQRVNTYSKNYSVGSTFDVSGYTINVQDSYLLDSEVSGRSLTDGAIVAVRVQIKGYDTKSGFNSGILTLQIGDLVYAYDYNFAKALPEIGSAYLKQNVSNEFETYLFTFDVSKSQANKKMKLRFNEVNSFVSKNAYVRIKPDDLRKKDNTEYNKKINEKMNFSDSILSSSELVIKSFEINNNFRVNYKYCLSNDKCVDSYEYVSASASGNYFKTLMKISGDISIDKIINSSVYDMTSFMNNFGTIHYKIDNEWKKMKIDSEIIKPKKIVDSNYYIEVPYEVSGATEIYLTFNIRNKSYKYTLK